MQKLIARMKNEYEALSFKRPTLNLTINTSLSSEDYELTYRKGELTLRAEGEKGALLGLHHLFWLKEKWPEFLGKHHPKTSLRALWVEGDESGYLSDSIFCSYPKKALKEPFEFIYTIYKQGFNAVVFGGGQDMSTNPFPTFPFPVILKPNFSDEKTTFSPLDMKHAHRMKSLKNILFESQSKKASFFDHPKTKDFTKKELLIKEAHLPSSCYYLVDSPLLSMIDDFEKGVTCVVERDAPLISEVQKEPYPSQTPLVALVTFEKGRGDFSLMSRRLRAPLIGMIAKIPKESDDVLEKDLVASAMMACTGGDSQWINELLLY